MTNDTGDDDALGKSIPAAEVEFKDNFVTDIAGPMKVTGKSRLAAELASLPERLKIDLSLVLRGRLVTIEEWLPADWLTPAGM